MRSTDEGFVLPTGTPSQEMSQETHADVGVLEVSSNLTYRFLFDVSRPAGQARGVGGQMQQGWPRVVSSWQSPLVAGIKSNIGLWQLGGLRSNPRHISRSTQGFVQVGQLRDTLLVRGQPQTGLPMGCRRLEPARFLTELPEGEMHGRVPG